MTTTVVKDSIVGDNWIYQTAQAVPIQRVIDEKTGQPTGDILTGPVRLAFDNLFELPPVTATMTNPKFGASLLFTPYADFSVLYEEYYAVCAREFPEYWDGQQYSGLHSPFRDQREKIKFGGFTPGCLFITSTSKFKPPVVDTRYNPIVDRSKVYPGVWAICAVNAYAYKDPRKKGVAFGLQSVMIIGDDTKFGGGAPDAAKVMAAAKGIAAPIVRPDAARMGSAQPPAAAPGIPGYTQPSPAPAGAPAPAYAPAPQGAPVMPGSPAPAAAPYMPPQPAGAPPLATGDDDDMSFMN